MTHDERCELDATQARALTEEAKRDMEALALKLLDLFKGGAHLALGYSSWGAYYAGEFGEHERTGYKRLDRARVLDALAAQMGSGEPLPTNEAQARELAPLLGEPAELAALWREVSASGRPTAARIKAARRRRRAVRSPSDLALDFYVPAFSVLDARQGGWRERKDAWLGLGIEPPLGENLLGYSEALQEEQSGTSAFDPVLTEKVYDWFCPAGGSVLDPFAGGAVRGIVAARKGVRYKGLDLRPEQLEANRRQAGDICPEAAPEWVEGDARRLRQLAPGCYDLLFGCPPYWQLERYSDDPRDLSALESYPAFLSALGGIVSAALALLRRDRFAVFVVGELREPSSGRLLDFPGDTIRAFQSAGAKLRSRAVLLTELGTAPQRAPGHFLEGPPAGISAPVRACFRQRRPALGCCRVRGGRLTGLPGLVFLES